MIIPEKDLKEMVGDPYPFDIQKERKFRFNWAAAAFTYQWLLYRRMIKFAFLYPVIRALLMVIIMGISSIFFELPFERKSFRELASLFSLLTIVIAFFYFGFYGDKIYFSFLKEKLHKGARNLEPRPLNVLFTIFIWILEYLLVFLFTFCFVFLIKYFS